MLKMRFNALDTAEAKLYDLRSDENEARNAVALAHRDGNSYEISQAESHYRDVRRRRKAQEVVVTGLGGEL